MTTEDKTTINSDELLTFEQRSVQVLQLLQRKRKPKTCPLSDIPESYYQIDKLPYYNKLSIQAAILARADIAVPFFRVFQTTPSATISHQTNDFINFGTYNYLDLNGHPEVSDAAKAAIDQYGTSASSSRIVSGERTIHQQLEQAIVKLYGTKDAIVFVSGHATNVSTIGHLFGENDLILHDALAHNSIVQGAMLARAKRISFPHNNMQVLEQLLATHRTNYQRVLLVTEGLYSMDGDIPPLKEMIKLKHQYKCFLMVDEAHSIGVVGERGLGVREHFDLNVEDVDIWMGTLSKTLASCGGYITGHPSLILYLRYTAPGFVYSVGISPPLAAASLKAIDLMMQQPERVSKLRENSVYFMQKAKEAGLDTGLAQGYAIIPIILGNSIKTIKVANFLYEHGVNVQPIIYPAVKDKAARLRFFISSAHSTEQIDWVIKLVAENIEKIQL